MGSTAQMIERKKLKSVEGAPTGGDERRSIQGNTKIV